MTGLKVINHMRRPVLLILAAALLACGLFGCGPYAGYGYDYPAYGYAPYSWGTTNYWGYQPDIVVNHPWENHWRGPDHHDVFHGPVGAYHGGGAVHGPAHGYHGGAAHGGGGHGGGGGHH
jgi:hypothetical protein